MELVPDFPVKLGMTLKAMSLSRVAVAHRLGVDKSLVGRWLSGVVHPTEHNLAKISHLLAEGLPQFSMADWYEDAAVLARRYGLDLPQAPAGRSGDGKALGEFLESVAGELMQRGSAYEGFWRTSRPSLLMPGDLFHDYGMIRRRDDGMIEVLMGGSGLDFTGYLFPVGGNISVFLYDRVGRSPVSVLCKGVALQRAMVLDGILMLAALDSARTPAAFPLIVERVGDLSGDREADDASYARIIEERPEPLDPLGDSAIKARIFRDIGLAAAQAGGEAILSVQPGTALSRGSTGLGLRG